MRLGTFTDTITSRITGRITAVLAFALAGGLLTAPAAHAEGQPGDHVYGHRCRTYDVNVTNENTVVALRDTAEIPGAICEIDAVKIADGTVIVWHDLTWKRVADRSTLPAGVSPTSAVKRATWAQVSRIRTKGGEPVPRLTDMIAAAGQYDIPLIVDVRNALPNAAGLVGYATQVGADVRYYQLLTGSCTPRLIAPLRDAGAAVGIKLLRQCSQTPSQLHAMGATFTQQPSFRLSDAYLSEANALGIAVGTLDKGMTEAYAESLVARGVSRVLLDRPKDALGWFS